MKFIECDVPSLLVPVGSKIKFEREKQRFTVMASNAIFLICTKPFNARKTVLYTMVDLKEKIRGTENLIFGMGAESVEDCEKMLERLTMGESAISYRNRIKLDVEKYYIIKK